MTNETKIVSMVAVVVIISIGFVGYLSSKSNPSGPTSSPATADPNLKDAGQLVRADNYFRGPKDAKVTVVEFADYQCPACKIAYPVIKEIGDQYTDKSVKFIFRNFPLESHKNSLIAHNAAEEAGKEGKFWEMHNVLYEKQDEWSADGVAPKTLAQAEELIVGYAKDLGLDSAKVRQAIDNDSFAQTFSRDLADGEKLGVTGTPSIFVDGTKLKSYGELKAAIDTELAK